MDFMNRETILKMGKYRELNLQGVDEAIISELYKFMLRLRRTQEALIEEYHPADEMRCPVHFCIGQEAVPAALSLLMKKDDYLLSHHRTHGYFLAKGASMKSLFAELYGKETGANGGVAGSQDISMTDVNFCSGAILTGATAIAAGVAFGYKLKGNGNVAFTGFGDGATDEGLFWETMNNSALKKLPVVFICENNGYATYAPQSKRHAKENISERVASFGVECRSVFGNDAVALYSMFSEAIENVRRGNGPFFVEAFTYRLNAHVGPEDDDYLGYRPENELNFWKRNCPITLLEDSMIEKGLLTPEMKEKLIADINNEISEAFDFAKNSKFPEIDDWNKLNYSSATPLADKLLKSAETGDFDENQQEAVPGPY